MIKSCSALKSWNIVIVQVDRNFLLALAGCYQLVVVIGGACLEDRYHTFKKQKKLRFELNFSFKNNTYRYSNSSKMQLKLRTCTIGNSVSYCLINADCQDLFCGIFFFLQTSFLSLRRTSSIGIMFCIAWERLRLR